MKSILLTGINGTVAQVMKKELDDRYDVSGISIVRMDDVLRDLEEPTWNGQLNAFKERVMDQLTTAMKEKDAVVHLGWNTRGENCSNDGLDPLNIAVVDCVYRVAIAEKVSRIYMASSVHSYEFTKDYRKDVEPFKPFPDIRENPFGVPPTSLYGVSKRWMEIAGQLYAERLGEGQKILVVRLGGVGMNEKPHRRGGRLWDSHGDLAGLLEAFIESEDAPKFWIAFGVSNNYGEEYPRPLFDTVNPYGFEPADNSYDGE